MTRPVKRAYDASRRQAAARETQGHIAAAARDLFVERGYVATSIRDIAERAGVSVQTIYNAFEGGKAAIFGRVLDIAVVGDDEPVALRDRPEYRRTLETKDPDEVLAFSVGLAGALYRRMEPLIPTIRAAVAADSGIAGEWAANYGRNRYEGIKEYTTRLGELKALRPGIDVTRATDIIWTVLSLENYEALVAQRGWTPDDFAAWSLSVLRDSLLRRS
jgi:AcrR family transcriptional regulator